MSIYDEHGKAYRIAGSTGNVANSRRVRTPVTSKYSVGAASDHKWDLGRPDGFGKGRNAIKGPKKQARSRSRRGR